MSICQVEGFHDSIKKYHTVEEITKNVEVKEEQDSCVTDKVF